eukprot:1548206-Rhodomonas_salina.1
MEQTRKNTIPRLQQPPPQDGAEEKKRTWHKHSWTPLLLVGADRTDFTPPFVLGCRVECGSSSSTS